MFHNLNLLSLFEVLASSEPLVDAIQTAVGRMSLSHFVNFFLSLSLFEALAKSEPLIDAIQTAVGYQVQQDVHLPPGEVLTMMMIVVLLLLLLWLLVLVLVDNTHQK